MKDTKSAELIKLAELLNYTEDLIKKAEATKSEVVRPEVDKNVFRIAKLAALTECAKYICKIAEMQGEQPATEQEVIEMVARADGKVPDEVIETADNGSLKVMLVDSLVRAAEEMSQEPSRVAPEDVKVKNLGEGSILKEVATNPNARVDGVDILPEVNIIELNLLSTNTGEGEKKMENTADIKKIATLTQNMLKLANEVEALKNKVDGLVEAVNPGSDAATKTEDVTQANPREVVSALTKEDNIYEPKTNDAEVAALVAAPDKSTDAATAIVAAADGSEKQSFASDKERLAFIVAKYNKAKKK